MTTCDGCGAQTGPLMKLSLGRDFFNRAYDRLSPSTDQSPKWYCEGCSMLKNLQRDLRDIRTEFDKLRHGHASALESADERQRAHLRVREIATIVEAASTPSPLLPLTDVTRLLNDLHAQTASV